MMWVLWAITFLGFVLLTVCCQSIGQGDHISSKIDATSKELECGMRDLALRFARTLHYWRSPEDELFRQIHDALQLTTMCGRVPPPQNAEASKLSMQIKKEKQLRAECSQSNFLCLYVVTNSSADGDGSIEHPIGCLHKALNISRSSRQNTRDMSIKPARIILRQGIHELHFRPLVLFGDIDSELEILSYPGEEAWISGGVAIPPAKDTKWKQWKENEKIWVADLSELFGRDHTKLPRVFSLFTSGPEHNRLIRARYPNGNPELNQWGYTSPDRNLVSIRSDVVLEWHKPEAGPIPTFDLITLEKNDSTMNGYNVYASGHGGVCASQWGSDADSYWCSNYSQGGWAEVDRECAMTGKLQIPVGMTWNVTAPDGKHLSHLSNEDVKNGTVFAWHSQTWAMHMFRISGTGVSASSSGSGIDTFYFEEGGGKQGGRNWCRCDQCTYAGGFCGQHRDPPDNSDTRLIGGYWFVENLLAELDQPGEFYFNSSSYELYVYPNVSGIEKANWKDNLRFAILENIVELRNVSNVAITNVGFRDSAATFMSEWSAPSGGDWSLHRGGAVFLENTTDIVIRRSTFRRLDGNALFLSRRNRNVIIEKNIFEWLGENAIATWGETEKYDATDGNQPHGTMVYHNVMRELGIYEKQSSALAQAKAALSDVRNNIMFNMPRAGINFNDMMGGGDQIINNLIFNSCRESGDHGPINSWDRQPYRTRLKDGRSPGFDPIPRKIIRNFIFANYGADQAVDNDDGSSWFHVAKNVFYDASGFKMDYGGHDSKFEENLVLASGRKSCIGFGSFLPGHGHIVQNNTCIVGLQTIRETDGVSVERYKRDKSWWLFSSSVDNVAGLERCEGSHAILRTNKYYTPHGNASFSCEFPEQIGLEDVQKSFGLELGSTTDAIPDVKTLIRWAKALLFER